jgi:tetratricopeptide (TPR) repeat protein
MKLFTCCFFIATIFCGCDIGDGAKENVIPFVEVPRDKTTEAMKYADSAREKINNGDIEGAEKDLGRSINADPYLSETYSTRAELFFIKHDYRAALKDCDKTVELSPNKAIVYSARGNILASMKRYDDAIKDYTKCIGLEPGAMLLPQMYEARGCLYLIKNDLKTAMTDLDEALRLDPKLADGYYFRSTVKISMGDKEGACADLNKGAALGSQLAKEGLFHCR